MGKAQKKYHLSDLLNGESELESVKRIGDTDFPLNFRVRERGHDGAAFDVGSTGGHVPSGHPHPQLQPSHDRGSVPKGERGIRFHRFLQ